MAQALHALREAIVEFFIFAKCRVKIPAPLVRAGNQKSPLDFFWLDHGSLLEEVTTPAYACQQILKVR